jgi:hypothetical protein
MNRSEMRGNEGTQRVVGAIGGHSDLLRPEHFTFARDSKLPHGYFDATDNRARNVLVWVAAAMLLASVVALLFGAA